MAVSSAVCPHAGHTTVWFIARPRRQRRSHRTGRPLRHPDPGSDGSLGSGSGVGRSAWSDLLTVNVTLHTDSPEQAAVLGQALARHAVSEATSAVPADVDILALEVLAPEETERRSAHGDTQVEYYSVSEAADLLEVTPGRIRQRAAAGDLGAIKIGGAGWAVRKDLVEREAAARRDPS